MKKKFYLIGIKGAGMSALANVLYDMGAAVSGSDIKEMIFTQVELEAKGIKLEVFGQATIEGDMTVILGNAFTLDHPDAIKAKRVGARIVRYHEFLGQLSKDFISIAISGTHGKTTTTGMISHVFRLTEPTSYLIGDGTGKGVKNSKYFIFEACEYRRHFHAYAPEYLIITNIEHDHPDYFTDTDDVLKAFQVAVDQTRKQVIMCGDDENVRKINTDRGLKYGFMEHNDIVACNVIKDPSGTTFDVLIKDEYYHTFKTPFYGDHMILNSLALITVCYLEGMKPSVVEDNLAYFQGVKRRFNEKDLGKQLMIDDYAHHPTEIEVTLKAAKQKYPGRTIVAIFQPHTFTRTKAFASEFANVLKIADVAYLTEIFGSAREKQSDFNIGDFIASHESFHLLKMEEVDVLAQYEDAVLIFMGAGDIEKYESAYIQTLK